MSNRRQRRSRNPAVPWTPAVAMSLTVGPDPLIPRGHPNYLSDEALRSAWALYGARLLTQHPASRLWAWWRFHGEVPAELRGRRPQLVAEEDHAAYRQELDDLRAARERWLASHRSSTSPTP